MNDDVQRNAAALVAPGKGILAADETVPTLTRRFDALGIRSTEESRRTYREMLFTPQGIGQFVSGIILHDETIRQQSSTGAPFPELLAEERKVPTVFLPDNFKTLIRENDSPDVPFRYSINPYRVCFSCELVISGRRAGVSPRQKAPPPMAPAPRLWRSPRRDRTAIGAAHSRMACLR